MDFSELKEFAAIYHHKFLVLKYLNSIIRDLLLRSEEHDSSKFSEDEFLGHVALSEEMQKCKYGTPEHDIMREKNANFFGRHYKKNKHHPEHYSNGIDDMDLVDILEMLCDWKAASTRSTSGSIGESIVVGSKKYSISPQLQRILENTARNYKM